MSNSKYGNTIISNDYSTKIPQVLISATMLILSLLFLVPANKAIAQATTSNPGEYAAVSSGNETINGLVGSQTGDKSVTAALQTTMSTEFTMMDSWEKKYNSYLKTATGYASSLKAATQIYSEGVRIFMTLDGIRKAVNNNPQGIVATVSMNNLYMETLTEMVSTYSLLKEAVAKGGSTNMLTGAERSKTLWALEDKLTAFRKKLNLLYLSIRHYNLVDMWNHATAGMIERNKGDLARQSLDHWKRHAREVHEYGD